jgi:hypothetical protein
MRGNKAGIIRTNDFCPSAVVSPGAVVFKNKAAEDSRTPKPDGFMGACDNAIASWSAAVLCRFWLLSPTAFLLSTLL